MNKKTKIVILFISLAVVLFFASKIFAIEYTLDQSYTATPDILAGLKTDETVAQTFTTGTTNDLGKIVFKLYKVGSPTGNMWFEVWTDGETYPDTKIATSESIDVSTLTTDTGGLDYNFYFESGTTLTDETTYWIVNGFDGAYSDENFVYMRLKNEGGYLGGTIFYFDAVWQSTGWDAYFLEYTQPDPTPTPSPTPSPPLINISGDMISGILASVSNIFSDLSLLFICLVGLPLGFWVIKKVIELLRNRKP